jgi:hypothetical protein
MDKAEFVAQIQADCRRIMEQVADAVNNAPTGNVISGSEMQVRDLMAELRHKAYQTAVQMRIDPGAPGSTFSPSEGRGRETAGRQRALPPSRRAGIGQRADQLVPAAVVRGPGGQRLPGG